MEDKLKQFEKEVILCNRLGNANQIDERIASEVSLSNLPKTSLQTSFYSLFINPLHASAQERVIINFVELLLSHQYGVFTYRNNGEIAFGRKLHI
jgi:hypothetical protein